MTLLGLAIGEFEKEIDALVEGMHSQPLAAKTRSRSSQSVRTSRPKKISSTTCVEHVNHPTQI